MAKLGHGDPSKVYYVYELYTIMSNGREKVYYVGQGKNGRVYDHEKAYRRKIRNPRTLLSPKEKMMLFIEDNGWPLLNRIVQSGLNQDQAFNLENEVITHYGLQNLTNIARPRRIRVVTE